MKTKILIFEMILALALSGCQTSRIGLDSIVAKQVEETLTAVSIKIEPTNTHVSTASSTPKQTLPVVPSNWKNFETDEISIWLPDSYIGGNVREDVKLITENLKKLGPQFEQLALIIEQNPDLFVLFVTDSETGPSGFLTNMNVVREKIVSTVTLKQYMDIAEKSYPPQYHIVENKTEKIGDLSVGRLVTEFVINGVSGKQVQFIIMGENEIWGITYSTGFSEFDDRLTEFENSINTFRIKPK